MSTPKTEVPYGTLDLVILKTLDTMGAMHGYSIARRIEQVADNLLHMSQGSIYPALIRLEQQGWIRTQWGVSETNRKVKIYSLTAAGKRSCGSKWRTGSGRRRWWRDSSRPSHDAGGSFGACSPSSARAVSIASSTARCRRISSWPNATRWPRACRRRKRGWPRAAPSAASSASGKSTAIAAACAGSRTLGKDFRYGLLLLRRDPGFAFVAIGVMAIGIGANTAMFSLMDGVLLKPLPYPEPERIVRVMEAPTPTTRNGITTLNFLDWKRLSTSFEALSATRGLSAALTGQGDPARLNGMLVSADYFEVFGVKPALGRTFLAGEDRAGRGPVVVLSHAMWQSRFAGDPAILNRDILLDGEPHQVVGVLPAGSFDREQCQLLEAARVRAGAAHARLPLARRRRPPAAPASRSSRRGRRCSPSATASRRPARVQEGLARRHRSVRSGSRRRHAPPVDRRRLRRGGAWSC